MASILTTARAFIGRSDSDVRKILGSGATEYAEDEYQKLENLASIENLAVFPGTLYLKDGSVELVYLGDAAVTELTRDGVESELSSEPHRLRSRAGKKASMFVYASEGVAFSAAGRSLNFVEVFRPRSQKEYEAEIYREPKPFIR